MKSRMREIRTSGSVGAWPRKRLGYPTTCSLQLGEAVRPSQKCQGERTCLSKDRERDIRVANTRVDFDRRPPT